MKVFVDEDLCIGCELCTGIESDVFFMNDNEKAEATETVDIDKEPTVAQAIEMCPVTAIKEI